MHAARLSASAMPLQEKRRGLLLPGSPDSTLLYAADRAEQEQHWCWWRRDVWLADTAFDEETGRAVYESDKNCRIRRGSSNMAPTMSRLAALDALATECQARVLQHGAQATVKRTLDACSATPTPKKQRDTASAPARSGARRGTSLTARRHSAATPPSKAAPSLSPDGRQCGPSVAEKRGQVRPQQTKVAGHQVNMDIDLLAAGTAEAECDDKADAMMQHGAGRTKVATKSGQRLALQGESEAGHMKGPEVKAFRTRACARTRVAERSSRDALVAADVFDVCGIDDDTVRQGVCGVEEKDPFAVSPSTQRIRSSKVCSRQRVLESKGATVQETTHDMGNIRGRRRYSREKVCIESRDVTGMKAEEVNGQSETGRKRRVGRVAMQTNEEATMDGPRPKRGRTHALADEEQSEEKEPVEEEGMAPEADSVETRQQQASPSRLSRRDSLLKHAGKTRAHKAPTRTAATANAATRWPEPKRHASSKAPMKPSEEAAAGSTTSVRATKPRMQPSKRRNLAAAAAASTTIAAVGSDVINLARQLAAGIVPRDSHPVDTQALHARTTSPSLPPPPAYATTPSTNSAGVAASDAAVGQVKDPGSGKLVAEPEGQRAEDAASASAALARRAAMRAPIVTAYYARAWQTRGTLTHVSHLDPAARQVLVPLPLARCLLLWSSHGYCQEKDGSFVSCSPLDTGRGQRNTRARY